METSERNQQRRRREMSIHRPGPVVLAAMILALGAAPAALDGQEAAVITGRVTNAQGRPEANATVTIRIPGDVLRATTSATGAYVIRGVPAGAHRISVNARGASPQTRTLRVAPAGTVRADFVLEPAAERRPQTQAPARQLQAVGAGGDAPDIRVDSPRPREGFRTFWASLPRAEAAALDQRLAGLDSLARRDGDVDRDLAAIRRQHPELFRLSATLQRETWNLVGPGGVDEGSVECNGLGWIGVNGKVRCIGKLVVSD
jgi:hypothetical protein